MRQSGLNDSFGKKKGLAASNALASESRRNVLASLRATAIVASKPVLPAELIALILDYLPIPDLLRCARVSRRLQEMVYDDTRWVQKLKAIGVWDENEARQRHEQGIKKKFEGQALIDTSRANGTKNGAVTLFDAGVEEENYRKSIERPTTANRARASSMADGFDDLSLSGANSNMPNPNRALNAMKRVRSSRGQARHEYGKVYQALGVFYVDLVRSSGSTDPLLFRAVVEPEQQARVLADVRSLSYSDSSVGYDTRETRIENTIGLFENAALREFEAAYRAQDVLKMRKYALVLTILNGGAAAVDSFIQSHPLMQRTLRLANPMDSVDGVSPGHVDLGPSHRFFEGLAGIFAELSGLIDKVFAPSVDVLLPFVRRVSDDVVQEFVNVVLDETHKLGKETYLKAVPGVFEQCMRFTLSLQPTKASAPTFKQESRAALVHCFDSHIDLYLNEELAFFKAKAENEVIRWEKDLSDQEAQAESFFMSNVNRNTEKNDFLSSFKKVIMMPVNVLPTFPSKSAALDDDKSRATTPRPSTPVIGSKRTPSGEAPATELAAKAAIMNSRLEGIKSLFSIEVALNLVHHAKSSIERAVVFVRADDHFGDLAKSQCEAIFISLLQILGQQHIKAGFDRAVGHLSNYNPREVAAQDTPAEAKGVAPLVTFLELVNVGDLIQQMVDVFYVQELVTPKLTDRDDFLNPAGKAKKYFEQMLDERVAAGMSKGIDVLISEVEHICSTTQPATDFNPLPEKDGIMDIGPTTTAKQVVDTLEQHTTMLVGSTDKNMLDVFNQEVGLRLFGVICKHIKRQRISVDGAIKLISDINLYSSFVATLHQKPLTPYFTALRELSQIYLVDCNPAPSQLQNESVASPSKKLAAARAARTKELATIIADTDRYRGIFGAEEVYEFAERRADWYSVRRDLERAMYGMGCVLS